MSIRQSWLATFGLGLLAGLAVRSAHAAQFNHPTQGFIVTYPDSWNAKLSDSAVFFRNFPPEKTPEGGVVPPGGAVIEVQAFPPYYNPYFPPGRDDYSALDDLARPSTVIARTSPSSGQPARVTFILDGLNLREVWTVRHLGGRVFLVSLSCATDDSQISAYEQVFDAIVGSISPMNATPGPVPPTP